VDPPLRKTSMAMGMRIAIVGAGDVDSAFGNVWLRTGEALAFGLPIRRIRNIAPYQRTGLAGMQSGLRMRRSAFPGHLSRRRQTTVKSLRDLCTNPFGMGLNGLKPVLGHRVAFVAGDDGPKKPMSVRGH
jgi:hypothetical protein